MLALRGRKLRSMNFLSFLPFMSFAFKIGSGSFSNGRIKVSLLKALMNAKYYSTSISRSFFMNFSWLSFGGFYRVNLNFDLSFQLS